MDPQETVETKLAELGSLDSKQVMSSGRARPWRTRVSLEAFVKEEGVWLGPEATCCRHQFKVESWLCHVLTVRL